MGGDSVAGWGRWAALRARVGRDPAPAGTSRWVTKANLVAAIQDPAMSRRMTREGGGDLVLVRRLCAQGIGSWPDPGPHPSRPERRSTTPR